jgi:hypothetical protein
MVQKVITDIDNWQRVGRGRTIQFYATDEEVYSWFIDYLPAEYGPYYVVASIKGKDRHSALKEPARVPLSALIDLMRDSKNLSFNYWIGAEKLTPDLPLDQDIDAMCSYNGLVLLQHGLILRNHLDHSTTECRDVSRIAVTSRVKSLSSGELREHAEYLKIYNRVHRVVSRHLIYSTIIRYKDGREEETRLYRMTEGAVQSYNSGFPFCSKPGRLIKKM